MDGVQAGVDVLESDRLGQLKLTREGLRRRNAMVYRAALEANKRLVITVRTSASYAEHRGISWNFMSCRVCGAADGRGIPGGPRPVVCIIPGDCRGARRRVH
jgi:hypothetical protein